MPETKRYILIYLAAIALHTASSWTQQSFCTAASTLSSTAGLDTYDYIIVGAGTAGLVLANRLSELPNLNILVIDPGDDQTNNPAVQSIPNWLNLQGSEVDWNYNSTPQVHANDRVLQYHAGFGWGGTSLINGMTYIRGQEAEFDAWQYLLDPDNTGSDTSEVWNWSSLYPTYYQKSESFTAPTAAQISQGGATYNPSYHGTDGPVKVAYPFELANTTFASISNQTYQKLGLSWNPDFNGGDVTGFSVWPQTVDRDADVRQDAARVYYNAQVRARPNLKLIKGTVNRVIWNDDDHHDLRSDQGSENLLTAAGVEYVDSAGHSQTVHAKREVILSAGALRSPGILERSGVGNPSVLSPLHIPTRINLPGVGENLQDQPNSALLYSSSDLNISGTAPYATFASMRDILQDNETQQYAADVLSQIPLWAVTASQAVPGDAISAGVFEQLFRLQHGLLFRSTTTGSSPGVPAVEILTTAFATTLATVFWPLHPFSRGRVHVTDAAYPDIDPNFFAVPFDLTFQRIVAQRFLAERFWRTQPMSAHVSEQVSPPPPNGTATSSTKQDDNEEEEEEEEYWNNYLLSTFTPNYHPLGTCAMQARSLGGVVDGRLVVYGTSNVRVVDASVLPMQISGHLTATIYAVAERVADMIKQDCSKSK